MPSDRTGKGLGSFVGPTARVVAVLCALGLQPAHSEGDSSPTPRVGAVTGSVRGYGEQRKNSVVVFLEDTYELPRRRRRHGIGQRRMRFEPSYMVIGKGDTVSFPNGDAVTHNVFSVSRANRFDLGLYNPGANKHVSFPTVGVVDVFCNIHENMHATVVVVPSSHFATVAEEGGFVFSGVRPGRHDLVVWRRGKEVARETIVVSAGKNSRIKIRKGD